VLAGSGYAPPQPRTQIPAPGTAALATLETGVYLMGEAGLRLRARPESRPLGRLHSLRRPRHRRNPGQRTVHPRPRARGLPLPLRRAKTQERIAFTSKPASRCAIDFAVKAFSADDKNEGACKLQSRHRERVSDSLKLYKNGCPRSEIFGPGKAGTQGSKFCCQR
jgi:hypothetical protein